MLVKLVSLPEALSQSANKSAASPLHRVDYLLVGWVHGCISVKLDRTRPLWISLEQNPPLLPDELVSLLLAPLAVEVDQICEGQDCGGS
jgi:hypothetical protein